MCKKGRRLFKGGLCEAQDGRTEGRKDKEEEGEREEGKKGEYEDDDEERRLTIIWVAGAPPGALPPGLGVRVDHPPAGLTRPLVLYPDELVVQGEVVPDRVLGRGELVRVGMVG